MVNKDLDKCSNNTICNESGICVCDKYLYGENCENILKDSKTLNVNKGFALSIYYTIVLSLSLILPFILLLGMIMIFIFLKGRDSTYIT